MRGKEKCKALKEIRRQIAEENDIPYVVSQCTHQGECRGTCPKCEAELRYLERELAIRQGLGKAVAVVGISTSVCAGLTACSPIDMARNALGMGTEVQELDGDISLADPGEVAGFLEEVCPESEQGGMEETEIHSTAPVESAESQEIEELAGALPLFKETEETEETEEFLMGEIPVPEYLPEIEGRVDLLPEESISEIEGDIALHSGWENSAESQPPLEETTP